MGELQGALEGFFDAFERGDGEALASRIAGDAQGVDEISRRWLRGPDEVRDYVRQLVSMVTGVKTAFSDVNEIVDGDRGLLTCWMDQTYEMDGASQHVSAPTTVLFSRVSGEWKLSLFHSIPLPDEA